MALARAVADGELDLSGTAEPEPTIERLRAIAGVGEWTAATSRCARCATPTPSRWATSGVRHGFAALGLATTRARSGERAERWRPWRAYAAMHLWHLEREVVIRPWVNYLRLLRSRPFALLWTGSTVSAMGDSMTWVALVWIAFERGGAGLVSALVVVSTAPVIVGGFAMGLLLDRSDRRRVLVRVNLVLGLAVASVPLWFALVGPPPTCAGSATF